MIFMGLGSVDFRVGVLYDDFISVGDGARGVWADIWRMSGGSVPCCRQRRIFV